MKRSSNLLYGIVALIVLLSTACTGQRVSAAQGSSYHSALKTNYQDALNVQGQLALGTLELENTENQVTQDEAIALLPPWEALQASAAKSTVEQQALLEQIESTMSGAQIAAIAAMQLTQVDAQAWLQSQGANRAASRGSGQLGGGAQGQVPEAAATRRAQFQNASPEQRATFAARFGSGQGQAAGTNQNAAAQSGSAGGQAFTFPLSPLIALLATRSGQGGPQPTPATSAVEPKRQAIQTPKVPGTLAPTFTPTPVDRPTKASPPATSTPEPTPTPTALAPISTVDPASALAPAAAPASDPPGTLTSAVVPASDPPDTAASAVTPVSPLTRLRDADPGPPFTIEISANRATQDPLVEESYIYLVTGMVRNDSERTYTLDRINVTFFDGNGFRGHFRPFPNRRSGGEWIWFGATEAECACVLLAPGEACPFSVEITAQDIVSFLVHPDAAPTGRESVPVALDNLNVTRDPSDYVRITGTASNTNPFDIKNVIVSGALLDDSGQMVSLGSGYVLQEDIGPGATVPFDLRVPYKPYVDYQLYSQAERDWK